MTDKELISAALSAREHSYSPYSQFKVGAALLCTDGRVFTGCNVENASYSATVCAERAAVFKAVSEGAHAFSAIAIVGGKDGALVKAYPCGVCRQVLSEFGGAELRIIIALSAEEYEVFTLGELLPNGFLLQ